MSLKGTPNHMKYLNKKRILHCIQEHAPISRAEIAVQTQLSKPTVSALVDELIQENWVIVKGPGESSTQGGRRPTPLYFNEKAAYIIGTDIGRSYVKIIISDLVGNIIDYNQFPTPPYLLTGILQQISDTVNDMLNKQKISLSKILGLGAGVPGITDTQKGLIYESPSLGWKNYDFLKEAKKHFTFPVYVDNDTNVEALGEQWLGNAKQKKNVLYISIGTGIGSGIIIENQLYRGYSSSAGELGYMVTNKEEIKNHFKPIFNHFGYLESVSGGKSIGIKLTERIKKNEEHPLFEEANKVDLTGKQAFSLARQNDALALSVINEAAEHWAYSIINAASLLNPEIIILGGNVSKSADLFLPYIQNVVNSYLPSNVTIMTSHLGDNSGVLGAVSLLLREHDCIIQHK